jgi:hypothetical protein
MARPTYPVLREHTGKEHPIRSRYHATASTQAANSGRRRFLGGRAAATMRMVQA